MECESRDLEGQSRKTRRDVVAQFYLVCGSPEGWGSKWTWTCPGRSWSVRMGLTDCMLGSSSPSCFIVSFGFSKEWISSLLDIYIHFPSLMLNTALSLYSVPSMSSFSFRTSWTLACIRMTDRTCNKFRFLALSLDSDSIWILFSEFLHGINICLVPHSHSVPKGSHEVQVEKTGSL